MHRTKSSQTFFKPATIQKILNLYQSNKPFDIQSKCLFSLLSTTGQKISPLLQLKKSDFKDLGHCWAMTLKIKGMNRQLPIPPQSKEAVLALLSIRKPRAYLFQATRGVQTKRPITPVAAHLLLKSSLRQIGKKSDLGLSLHSFRRTVLADALESYSPHEVRSTISFHSNMETLMEYAKKKEQKLLEDHPFLQKKDKIEEYETPNGFFKAVDKIFGGFTLDAAASSANSKTKVFYNEAQNSLIQSWKTSGAVWCNPPFSKNAEFVTKCMDEAKKNPECIVLLIPARTDTSYWIKAMKESAELSHRLDIKGRLKFRKLNEKGTVQPANFPTCLLVFNGHGVAKIGELNKLGFLVELRRPSL